MMRRAGNSRAQVTSTETFPAPSSGWVQSGNIVTAGMDQAEVLDNFIPTAQGARMRGGAAEHADIGAAAVRMMHYSSGGVDDFFAGTEAAIFDVDRISGGGSNTFGDVEGLTSGDWTFGQIATAGGQFMVCANGSDYVHYWDGSNFNPITDEAIFDLGFDAQTGSFTVGATLTGGTSGATAEILGITKTSATAGTLRLGAITGTFQDNEILSEAGAAELVTNGTFDTDTTGWTFEASATNSSAAGYLEGTTGGATNQLVSSSFPTVIGQTYKLTTDVVTAPNFAIVTAGTTAFGSDLATTGLISPSSISLTFVATTTTTFVSVFAGGASNLVRIDNVSAKLVNAVADGTSSAGSTVAITGVDTSTLSQVWNFKERFFFVEKDTANVWYLPTESIGGAALEFPLGSVFGRGGSVLFGATWSLDSGSGMDDVCLFVSDQGEVAVYEGSNPSSVSTWSLVGVYEIGRPLNKHGHFRAGGDLAVLTEDGIIPISEALKKDRAALQTVAISYPIEDAWKSAIANRTISYPISVSLWQSQTLLLIGTPAKVDGLNVSFAANARTGAWARFTGWDVRASIVVADQLYFADNTGKIFKADNGGLDDGASYTCKYVGKFSPSDQVRAANAVGITYRAVSEVPVTLDAMSDYNVTEMDAPSPIANDSFSTWGAGIWGTFVWGDTGTPATFTTWQSAYAVGYSLAPAVEFTSNETTKPDVEILMTRVRSERGYAL